MLAGNCFMLSRVSPASAPAKSSQHPTSWSWPPVIPTQLGVGEGVLQTYQISALSRKTGLKPTSAMNASFPTRV